MKIWPSKDPDEILRYSYDWSPDLATGEVVTNKTLTPIVAAGTVIDALLSDDTHVTAVISGGTDGLEASYTIRAMTNLGNTFEDVVALPIIAKSVVSLHPGGYVEPTCGHFVGLFPEFQAVSKLQVDYYLQRAAASVDTSWSEEDFAYARMLLTAHLLTINGIGDSAEAATIREGSGEFRSMAIGPLRLERFDRGKGQSSSSLFATTRYGREFLTLLRRNKGGPRVAGYGSAAAWGDGDHFGPWTGP